MRRVDLIVPTFGYTQYGVLFEFTQGLYRGLVANGVDCRKVYLKAGTERLLETLFEPRPDYTLLFNGGSPMCDGKLLSERLGVPHIGYLVDAPYHFFDYLHRPSNIFTCVDRAAVPYSQRMGFDKMVFMPHAVDGRLNYDPHVDRPFDVVMMASSIDYERRRADWQKKYPKPYVDAMENAVVSFRTKRVSVPEALVTALYATASPQSVGEIGQRALKDLLYEIELYIRGRDRTELLKGLKGVSVHVFGKADGAFGWRDLLKDCPHITVHDEIPFVNAFEIMKQSKVILSSTPTIIDGSHERVLAAFACGAQVVSSESLYLWEQFGASGALISYVNPGVETVRQAVCDAVHRHKDRRDAVMKARAIVMDRHTWERRARDLVDALEGRHA